VWLVIQNTTENIHWTQLINGCDVRSLIPFFLLFVWPIA